jgi:hypothetical protein
MGNIMDSATTIAIVVTLLILAYLTINFIMMIRDKDIEGLTTADGSTSGPTAPAIPNSASAGAAYAASILTQCQVLRDQLLMSQYKADYEKIIINMEDYVNLQMVATVLQTDKNGAPSQLDKLATLKQAKDALNDVMAYVDKNK